MSIEHKLAIATLIVAFTSPFVKALAERWIARPVAIPQENTPADQNHQNSRLSRFLMSDGYDLFLSFLALLTAIPLAFAPVTGFNVFIMALSISLFMVKFVMKPRLNRLSKDMVDLITIVNRQQVTLANLARSATPTTPVSGAEQ
jgi:hypothetical protein